MTANLPQGGLSPGIHKLALIHGLVGTPEDDSGVSGYKDLLGASVSRQISAILDGYGAPGGERHPEYERQALLLLAKIRGDLRTAGFLTAQELDEIDDITGGIQPQVRPRTRRSMRYWRNRFRPIEAVAVGLVLLFIGLLIAALVRSTSNTPPVPSGNSGARPAAGQVPLQDSPVQAFMRDWGSWTFLAPQGPAPNLGAPGVLLITNGIYQVSKAWYVPAQVAGWIPDNNGNAVITSRTGKVYTIQDSVGNVDTVTDGQAFVISADPSIVIMINGGKVYTITLAQAAAERQTLSRYHAINK